MTKARTLDKQEIVEKLKSDEARKLFEDNGVLAAYLFGSVADGRVHDKSDIDVAIIFEYSVPRTEYFDRRLTIYMKLSDLLDTERIDVVPLNESPIFLAFQVLEHPIVLYSANERRRVEFELKTIGEYHDFKPVLDEYGKEMFKRIKERGLR